MRISVAVTILGFLVFASSVMAEPADIAFRDIFTTLTTKVTKRSDQAFFEKEVLQARAVRALNSDYPGSNAYTYTYGPALSGTGSSYVERMEEGETKVFFLASDYSQDRSGGCVRFSEAEEALHRQNWSREIPATELFSDGERIEANYLRAGVVLQISNFVNLMPFLEPWNPAEVAKQQLAEAEVRRKERLKIKPGTKNYEALCVDSVVVRFTR